MRIVIDLQGAQTDSRFRGIGRYTMALAQGIARLRGQHDVIIAASDAFPESLPLLREVFASVLPPENFRVWQCLRNISAAADANCGRRKVAELVREAYLAELRPDVILISSLFEGLGDDAVASISALHDIPTAVVLYDLIPYIHRLTYLTPSPVAEAWYESQLSQLRRADLLLAISESSSREAEDYLGFAPERVTNIGAAADPQFRRQSFPQTVMDAVRARYGLTRPFVMYTGGIDHRKNIDRLISAFARLPARLRQAHQLVVVCAVNNAAQDHLRAWARREGLNNADFVLTGFVPDDDLIVLYHACATFVFPSWHEGFGLPALEATACGAPVIASNTSSLPEVVGLDDALFDPMDTDAISSKLQQVLEDPAFRKRLVAHGLQQATRFSWDITARSALNALENLQMRRLSLVAATSQRTPRPRLAYVSPMPPEQSGISYYSAELLPELARFYDIELIVDQTNIEPEWMRTQYPVRSPDWLRANPAYYERVLFHFGNSAFHHHMFDLLHKVPGVVVLHDFFLSGVTSWIEHAAGHTAHLAKALYQSHGYAAIERRFKGTDVSSVIWEFPCNAAVLEDAINVIVHSPNSLRLATQWYGPNISQEWSVVPHLRVPVFQIDHQQARTRVGLPEDAIVVCSFGLLGPTKLNHVLLEAWLASELARKSNIYLIFVGKNDGDDYGRGLVSTIKSSRAADRIRITGWADAAVYRDYLASADIAVQLRILSRGESSGTVLDCMSYGIATVVNAHGSMADLAEDTVWKLPDLFEPEDLVLALETLTRDAEQRATLGQRARHRILRMHNPRVCAGQYHEAIETAYRRAAVSTRGAIGAIGRIPLAIANTDLAQTAECLVQNQIRHFACQLLVDVSEIIVREAKTGIQRVVRGILVELLRAAPAGYRIEPVYASDTGGYRYARRWTTNFIGVASDGFDDDIVNVHQGDIFLALDLNHKIQLTQASLYRRWRTFGVRTFFVIYDLLPVRMPRYFLPGVAESHAAWLDVVAEADGVLCISKAVADDFRGWLREQEIRRSTPMHIDWFYPGSDLENTAPTHGMPQGAEQLLDQLNARPSFLMVGTVEPRKAHAQTLLAFEQLWRSGVGANLVIVGKQGWIVEELIKRFLSHPEAGYRFFWIADASNAYLERIYAACSCLIAASEGEGFDLPIIEAGRYGLPVIARDIPVFREIAQGCTVYFSGLEPGDMARVISEWLASSHDLSATPPVKVMNIMNWKQSAAMMLRALGISQPVTGSVAEVLVART